MKRTTLMLGITSLCVGCDQGTKRIAEHALKGHPLSFLRGAVELTYAENTGAFGSLGTTWPASVKLAAFVILPVVVLAGLAVQGARSRAASWLPPIAGALVLGGGLGNILDRVCSGYVIDFMILRAGPLSTNVFNVADVAVMAGVGLLLLDRRKPPNVEPPAAAAA